MRKYRLQGKPLTISHDQLLVTLVQAAPLVAAAKAARAPTPKRGSDRSRCARGASARAMDPNPDLDPDGVGGWMSRWADGVSLRDVPERAVLLAAAELTVRVDEEEGRRGAAVTFGVIKVWTALMNDPRIVLLPTPECLHSSHVDAFPRVTRSPP